MAVSSHTGTLVDQAAMASAMYDRAGVVEFRDTERMIKAAVAFSTQDPPKGRRIGIITNTGGPGIQAVDESVDHGLVLASWSPEGKKRLAESLYAEASLGNPVDVVATAGADHYFAAVDTLLREDGSSFPGEISASLIVDGDGNPKALIGLFRDITERKRAEGALREQVRRDPLTGVLNHAAIVEELRSLISDGGDGDVHAVAMIDVDDLKVINDTYGHQVGDEVLRNMAEMLTSFLRSMDHAGRYGGEEFLITLPETTTTDAQVVAEGPSARDVTRRQVSCSRSGSTRLPPSAHWRRRGGF